MSMPSWLKGAAVLTVVFAAGVAVGVSYERRQTPSHAPMAADAHDAMHRLIRDLDLDQGQQQTISAILSRHQAEIDETWRTVQPHMRTTLDATSQEIIAVLRPEQAEKYRRMVGARHLPGHR